MTSVIELYENLAAATDDKTRARIIAEAFEALEERYPNLSDVVTKTHLSETELRLQKEIKETELRLAQAIHRQTLWVVGAAAGSVVVIIGAIIGLLRFLGLVPA